MSERMLPATPGAGAARIRGQMLVDAGRYAEAKQVLRDALAADPTDERALCLMSLANLRTGQVVDARRCAEAAIGIRPTDEWPHRLLSIALLKQGHKHSAWTAANEAVRLDPDGPRALENLVNVARACHHTGHAREAADKLLRIAPQSASSHASRAFVFLDGKRPADAAGYFRVALSIDPLMVEAHNGLGVALLRLDDRAGALAAFQRAAQLDPKNSIALQNIRHMMAHDRLPLPRYTPLHPIILIPLLIRGVFIGFRRRRTYDALPPDARQILRRMSGRETVRLVLLVMTAVGGAAALVTGGGSFTAGFTSSPFGPLIAFAFLGGFLGLLLMRLSVRR